MKRIFLLILMLMLASTVGFAKQWIIIYAENPSITRRAFVGHTFAAFVQDQVFARQTKVECWGFYPVKKEFQVLTSSVPGILNNDFGTHRDHLFFAEVTNEEFIKCLQVKDEYLKEGVEYNLYTESCATFVRKIISAIPKLISPESIYVFPDEIVVRLKYLNQDTEQESERGINESISNHIYNSNPYSMTTWPFDDKGSFLYTPLQVPLHTSIIGGASSPQELGKVLFSALKTNDLALWMKCMYPERRTFDPKYSGSAEFNAYREFLKKDGVVNWNMLKFTKVVYDEKSSAKEERDGFSLVGISGYFIKFTYGDLIGELGELTIKSYTDGNYYMWWPGKGYNITLLPELKLSNISQLVGGATPDQLGQNIFKALQTNNKRLFINCVHPHPYKDDRARIAKDFHRLRDEFQESGLTQWTLARYGRTTYQNKLNQIENQMQLMDFTIEFTYKGQEFLGRIEGGDVVGLNNKFFLWHGGFASRFRRMSRY